MHAMYDSNFSLCILIMHSLVSGSRPACCDQPQLRAPQEGISGTRMLFGSSSVCPPPANSVDQGVGKWRRPTVSTLSCLHRPASIRFSFASERAFQANVHGSLFSSYHVGLPSRTLEWYRVIVEYVIVIVKDAKLSDFAHGDCSWSSCWIISWTTRQKTRSVMGSLGGFAAILYR